MPLKFLKKCRQYNVTSKSLFVISVHHLLGKTKHQYINQLSLFHLISLISIYILRKMIDNAKTRHGGNKLNVPHYFFDRDLDSRRVWMKFYNKNISVNREIPKWFPKNVGKTQFIYSKLSIKIKIEYRNRYDLCEKLANLFDYCGKLQQEQWVCRCVELWLWWWLWWLWIVVVVVVTRSVW